MSNWQRLTLLLGNLLIGACATTPQQTVVSKVETLPPIKIPVAIRCVSLQEVEPLPATHFRPSMTAEQLALAARADLDDQEAWAVRAEALLRACATEPQPEVKKP